MLLVLIYNIFLIILSIIFLPIIILAFIIQPKFRAGFFEKIGFYSNKSTSDKPIIFHAVSVGEVNAVKELIKEYKKANPDKTIIVTTTTRTGQATAKKAFEGIANKITYYPYDFFFSILSFLNTFKPEKVVIAETEIWPCFVTLAKLKGIKVYTVNGRISPHSFDGYKKLKFFLKIILNNYEKIYMQTKDDKERMINIGANEDKVEVMGNLKFDITQNITSDAINEYRNQLKTEKYRLFIAASTHKGEDEIILNAYRDLKSKFQDSKLLIAPRHPERYEEVISLIEKTGYNWGKRSNNDNFETKDIILLDTMGELAKLFSVCHIAFIGGSFSTTGGHNPLEANIWNKPVISGPCTFNFKDVYRIAVENKCAVIVNSQEELNNELESFYSDNNKYKEFCENAKSIFEQNKGAIKYVLERI